MQPTCRLGALAGLALPGFNLTQQQHAQPNVLRAEPAKTLHLQVPLVKYPSHARGGRGRGDCDHANRICSSASSRDRNLSRTWGL